VQEKPLKKPQTTLTVQSLNEYRQIKAVLNPVHYGHLTKLTIQNAKLVEVPATVQALKTLVLLDLSQNEIKTLKNLRNLVDLKQLNLSKNHIDLKSDMTDISMPNLILLDLSFNQIESLKQSFCRIFKNLSTLKLNNNSISFLNSNFGYLMYCLKNLDLSNNYLNFVPYSISNLRLDMLDLQMNDFKEVDSNFFKLNRLYPKLVELASRAVVDKK
jgi:Leucine-rich repeat (LRR) protein